MQDPGPGRRKLRRRRSRIPAAYQQGKLSGRGEVTNISRLGLFIRAKALPTPGTSIQLTLTPESVAAFEVTGTVRWTTDQLPLAKRTISGFGVELVEPTPEFLALLDDLMFA